MRLPAPIPERGFSIVELLVAMLIGLIGMVIIFQVFQTSEAIKRTTTSGGDSQQNGVIALYSMERDLKNAGMGFNDTSFVGCDIIGWDQTRTVQDFPPVGVTMKVSPVFITSGAATTVPDQVAVLYSSQAQAIASMPFGGNMTASTDALPVSNTFGYGLGDLLALVEPNSGKKCSIMEATAIAGNSVNHDFGATYIQGGASHTARFNKSGGLGVAYGGYPGANAARVFNLGNLYAKAPGGTTPLYWPVYNFYTVTNNTLTAAAQFQIANGQPLVSSIADNIVHMRALYGLDDGNNDATVPYDVPVPVAGDGVVDRFVDANAFNALVAAGPLPGPYQRLIAIKLVVVARSALPEKPSPGQAACDATLTEPQWSGTAWSTAPFNYATRLDVSATGDPNPASLNYWTCYRYRVFETTIPLRNWIWKSS